MNFKDTRRVCIFIDGSNLYHSLKKLNIIEKLNFQKLINELLRNRKLVNTFYYIAPLEFKINPKKYWKHQRFLDMLRKIPKFNVILCHLRKVEVNKGKFEFISKEDDVYLTTHLLSGAYEDWYDTAIIVSGDEDFVPVVRKIRQLGKRVGNAYFIKSSSQALRKICNFSVPLDKMVSKIID